jgi:hypothetical protein
MKKYPIDHRIIEEHENRVEPNITTTNPDIQKYCPLAEAHCFEIELEEADINLVYTCSGSYLNAYTIDYRLEQTLESARKEGRIKSFLDSGLNLSDSYELAPVFVCDMSPKQNLVAIDGNHRLIAHFLAHKSVTGLRAYLYAHVNAESIDWFPDSAKKTN